MPYRVTVSKVTIEDECFSVWETLGEALAHVGQLEQDMDLPELDWIGVQQSPVTDETLLLTITQEVRGG